MASRCLMQTCVLMLSVLIALSAFADAPAASNAAVNQDITDPTRPLNQAFNSSENKVKKSTLKLNAIYKRNGQYEAVVNQMPVREGDVVQGYTIVTIEANSLTYLGDTEIKLHLLPKVVSERRREAP